MLLSAADINSDLFKVCVCVNYFNLLFHNLLASFVFSDEASLFVQIGSKSDVVSCVLKVHKALVANTTWYNTWFPMTSNDLVGH